MNNKWVEWVTEIQSISQAGLAYSKDKFDIERFERLKEISTEIISEYTEVNFKKVKDLLDCEEGYLTPKVDVRAAIFKDDKILLVKESVEETWSMPGGWADINLSVSENVIKEVKEEAGLIVEPQRIIAILDRNKHNKPRTLSTIYKMFLLCNIVSGEFKENIETEESRFFELEKLPKLSLGRNNKEQIETCFDSYKNNNLKTIFD